MAITNVVKIGYCLEKKAMVRSLSIAVEERAKAAPRLVRAGWWRWLRHVVGVAVLPGLRPGAGGTPALPGAGSTLRRARAAAAWPYFANSDLLWTSFKRPAWLTSSAKTSQGLRSG